jgi:hypothetical protein
MLHCREAIVEKMIERVVVGLHSSVKESMYMSTPIYAMSGCEYIATGRRAD